MSPDPHHSEILRSGPKAWNAWREKNPNTVPDLTGLSLTSSERQLGPTHGGPLNLKAAGLRESHLRFATLSTADLQAADMSGADLMHAQLDQANLSAVNLSNARLDHADFAGATLTKVNLCGASLRFATLSTADLQAADMSGADLMHARLDHANLSAANLTDACLDYADFAGVNLSKVNLCGASLQHAKNLTQSQIKESTGSASTILPPHLQGSVPWSPARNPTIDLRPLPRLTAEVNVPHINSRNVQRWRVGAFFICVALVITAFVWQHMNETLTETNASLDAGDQGLRHWSRVKLSLYQCGMGELSHCLLYQVSFMEVGVKVPEGVEYPARPVDTGQSYRSSPSKKTVILWLVLSMLIRTVDATGFVAFDAA